MPDQMTPKERWLAAIHLQEVDHLPFCPKLDNSYPRAQKSPFKDMPNADIHDWIGSDQHVGIPGCIKEVRTRTSVKTIREDNRMRTEYRTPRAQTQMIQLFDEDSQAWHPVEHPVKTLDDIHLMTEIYEDVAVELDPDQLQQSRAKAAEIGQHALTTNGIGKSPLMHWVEFLAGIENAHYLLNDHRDAVETLFATMHRDMLDRARLVAEHSPADVLYLVENTSTTLTSPQQYLDFCYPHIAAYAAITDEYDRNLVLHMCGHLKALLPHLAKLRARAFEAFTSPTLGNTTLLDGRSQCADKCLIGGTNAMLWTNSADVIIARIEKDLDCLPHHRGIVVTSAGVMTPLCAPETIKEVCEWVKTYPARMN